MARMMAQRGGAWLERWLMGEGHGLSDSSAVKVLAI